MRNIGKRIHLRFCRSLRSVFFFIGDSTNFVFDRIFLHKNCFKAFMRLYLASLLLTDHITSQSALVMPIDKLIDVCKKRNVMTVVDGAHAPGQVKLSLREMTADFYVGKCCGCDNCVFLWQMKNLINFRKTALS